MHTCLHNLITVFVGNGYRCTGWEHECVHTFGCKNIMLIEIWNDLQSVITSCS